MKEVRVTVTALLFSATLMAPHVSVAQTGGSVYEEPKVKLGKADPAIAVAGKGTVIVQVFVKADGTFKVQRVIRTTNAGDNEAALAIARNSSYRPATRYGKPVDAFKDFTINFASSGVSTTASGTAVDYAQMDSMLRSGNYAGAKKSASAFLDAHPGDGQAYAVLGAADAFSNDAGAAAAAFDKAGTLPPKFVPLAAQAYVGNANALGTQKKYPEAVASARKAVALEPSVVTYNALGIQELASGDPASAVKDLESASKLAASDSKLPATARATVLANLASAYAANGQMDKAKTTASESTRLDPASKAGDAIAATLAAAAEAQQTQKKFDESAATFISAADFSPANAPAYYTRAAFSYLSAQPKPEPEKARDVAQKALATDANNANALFALGVAYADLGKKEDAKSTLKKAQESAKSSNQTALADKVQEVLKQLDAK